LDENPRERLHQDCQVRTVGSLSQNFYLLKKNPPAVKLRVCFRQKHYIRSVVYFKSIALAVLFLCLEGGAFYSVEPIGKLLEKQIKDRNLIIEDAVLRLGFVQLPVIVLRDSELSVGARLAYAVLLSYAWRDDACYPGQDTMAKDMGVSRVKVNQWMDELRKRGYISWKRRGLGKTNIYTIHRIRENVDNYEALSP
jgi:hypothetical protein